MSFRSRLRLLKVAERYSVLSSIEVACAGLICLPPINSLLLARHFLVICKAVPQDISEVEASGWAYQTSQEEHLGGGGGGGSL